MPGSNLARPQLRLPGRSRDVLGRSRDVPRRAETWPAVRRSSEGRSGPLWVDCVLRQYIQTGSGLRPSDSTGGQWGDGEEGRGGVSLGSGEGRGGGTG